MEPIEVTTQKDLESILKDIVSKYGPERLVFRGQVKDCPLVPTMYRGKRGIACIPELTANWGVCSERLISQFKKTVPALIETEAIMQHYGYRSFFVDVTSDPRIALWFALHKFNLQRTPQYVDDRLRSAIFQWSQYRSNNNGYLYAILLPSKGKSDKRYIDLTKLMPKDSTRIHKQQAGAVFCSPKSRSIDELVVAKLKVVDDGWFRNSNQNVKTNELFPPPSIDIFYRSLCNIPYFITSEVADKKIEVAHPLLGFFPIYAESIKGLVKEYVPLTRILGHAKPGLEWNVSTAVVDLENKRVKTRGATRVMLSSLMIQKISTNVKLAKELQTNYWPSTNLLLEFEPEASLVSPSPKTRDEIIRGMWVAVGTRSLLIAPIIDNFDEVMIGHNCIYSLPRLNLIKKQCSCPDHTYELELLCKASELLKNGVVFFGKGKLGYLELKYKEDSDKKAST